MLIDKIFGYVRIKASDENIKEILNLLSRLEISFKNKKDCIYLPLISKNKFFSLADFEIEYDIGGFLPFIWGYRKRWGIIAGALIFICSLYFSQKIVWCVDVSGNKEIKDQYIISCLEKQGFGVGTVIDSVDFDHLHNSFLIDNKDIAWIAVNMDGTHANVEVREVRKGYEKEKDDIKYFNLIAREDGQIERLASIEGKNQVKINDAVCKGELLVSGIISKVDGGGVRLESAKGSVYARVTREFFVTAPLEVEINEKTGAKVTKNFIKIFAFKLNLFAKGGIPYAFYDTIYSERQIFLFDTVPLPVWVGKYTYEEYNPKKTLVSQESAKAAATVLYREKLIETLGDAQLLSKTVDYSFDGNTAKITCRLLCLADIAKAQEIKVTKDEEIVTDGTSNSDTSKQ